MTHKKSSEFDYGKTMKELEGLLSSLETDAVDVDDALKKFEDGMKLITQLEDYLKTAENKVKKIQKKFSATK